jgi:hypothetical protein
VHCALLRYPLALKWRSLQVDRLAKKPGHGASAKTVRDKVREAPIFGVAAHRWVPCEDSAPTLTRPMDYRAYLLDEHGGIIDSHRFTAPSDEAAMALAARYATRHDVEVWNRYRRLALIARGSVPLKPEP